MMTTKDKPPPKLELYNEITEENLIKEGGKLGFIFSSLEEVPKLKIDEKSDQQVAIKKLKYQKKVITFLEEKNNLVSETEEEKVLREFNEKYAIIHTSSTYILMEKGIEGFVLDSRSSFIQLHENNFFTNNEGKQENKAKFWLKHPLRKTYVDIVFDVTKPPTFKNRKGEEVFNIFKGYTVKPKKGDASPFWNHLFYVICDGNEELYLYVRKRLASIIQNPKVLGCAIVLRGKQGTGKNQFVDHFGYLFGRHYLTFNSLDRITGRFNSHLQHAVVLFANEALWGGNKKEIGALKGLISDSIIFIEGKGKDGYQIENSRHLIVASNEDWAVPRDMDDRRFLVLDVSSERKEDYQYFADFDNHMKNKGGYEALLYDLQNEDLSNFNPRMIPINDAGFDMKIKSAPSSVQYLYYALDEKCWHIAGDQKHWAFKTEKSFSDLYADYKAWCEDEKLSAQSKGELGKTIKNIINPEKSRKGTSSRANTYTFPPLEQCRKLFETYSKQTDKIWSDNQ